MKLHTRIMHGNVIERNKETPYGSIDACIISPPYFNVTPLARKPSSPCQIIDISLVSICTVAHDLTEQAILTSLTRITPKEVISLTSNEGGPEKAAFSLWYELLDLVTTSHILHIEWDGWVLNGSKWNPNWLEYDYIGAPWPWKPFNRVGNGGFSLRSVRLSKFLYDHKNEFPLTLPEDTTLCEVYRAELENYGFRWAPEQEARKFSFECDVPRNTFGFHGIGNISKLLDPDELELRRKLADKYAKSKGFG
jgi:hypothetical protein